MSLYLKNGKEIAVIGHSDCQMAKCGVNELLDRMKAHGINRGVLPIPNLHEFFGLFSSEKPNVLKAVGFLRSSPIIPHGVPIHGLLIDTFSGRLEWVSNGYEGGGNVAGNPWRAGRTFADGKLYGRTGEVAGRPRWAAAGCGSTQTPCAQSASAQAATQTATAHATARRLRHATLGSVS